MVQMKENAENNIIIYTYKATFLDLRSLFNDIIIKNNIIAGNCNKFKVIPG